MYIVRYSYSNEAFGEGQLTRKMEVFRTIRSSAELKFHWISLDYGKYVYIHISCLHVHYVSMHTCMCRTRPLYHLLSFTVMSFGQIE